ncbi:hypothetical protein [Cellulomonas iranensis]|uniref:Uncharacterized protein n=1 Tax=Cellulomonas iranensis TaxID=76862 RepID=A0ABU0GMZ0_9CELL|nr:hypothetical protein [Cellulomonas iranensis]MDQ0426309.1 hypothetical protein [Cellulomonas iranensis]
MTILALAPAHRLPSGTVVAEPDAESVVAALLALDPEAPVLVVADSTAGRDAARAARLVLGQERVGVLAHEVPPTAFFVAVAALQMLPDIALGLAPSVLEGLGEGVRTVALVSSVAALERPRPSVALDLASRLPGSVFRVDWTAQTISRDQALDLPAGVATIATASERPVVAAGLPQPAQAHVDLATDGAFWGAKRWYEATVVVRALEETVEERLSPSFVAAVPRCASCARLATGPSCLFCQIPVPDGTVSVPTGGHV